MNLRPTLLLVLFSIVACCPADAIDQEFSSFWVSFKTALGKNDKTAIADMTKLPFMMQNKQLNKAKFIAQCDLVFPAKTKQCLLREKPVADKNSFFIFCGEEIYVFSKDKGKYKFIEIGAND